MCNSFFFVVCVGDGVVRWVERTTFLIAFCGIWHRTPHLNNLRKTRYPPLLFYASRSLDSYICNFPPSLQPSVLSYLIMLSFLLSFHISLCCHFSVPSSSLLFHLSPALSLCPPFPALGGLFLSNFFFLHFSVLVPPPPLAISSTLHPSISPTPRLALYPPLDP